MLDEGHAGHLEGLALPMGGGHGPAGGHSLQFLPHLPMPTSVTSSEHEPAMFIPSDFAGPQAMGGDAAHLAAPLGLPPLRVGQQAQGHPHMNGGSLELDPLGSRSSTFTMAGAPGAAPAAQQRQQARQSQRPGPRAGPAGAARASSLPVPAAAAKQPHSIVEKQRRDRINHLIDEVRLQRRCRLTRHAPAAAAGTLLHAPAPLPQPQAHLAPTRPYLAATSPPCLPCLQLRDLVPPQGTAAELGAAMAAEAAAAGDSRRPKHVVLSDTIRLIKDLQLQVAEMQVSPPAEGARWARPACAWLAAGAGVLAGRPAALPACALVGAASGTVIAREMLSFCLRRPLFASLSVPAGPAALPAGRGTSIRW